MGAASSNENLAIDFIRSHIIWAIEEEYIFMTTHKEVY